jgi:hypothetical protein
LEKISRAKGNALSARDTSGKIETAGTYSLIMSKFRSFLALFASSLPLAAAPLVFEGGEGPGKGKQVVLLAGDEEYRSEETMPMLAKLLSVRHGFRCIVLFSIDPKTGEIDPNMQTHLPGMEAIDEADVVIMGLRFRHLPDEDMEHLVNHVKSGKPLIALRTSTHAFKYPGKSKSRFAKWSFNSKTWSGGFGRQILGETWINHHGHHAVESTRGVVVAEAHPLMRGVEDVWGDTDVYGIRDLPEDATVLMRGRVLAGMSPEDPAVEGKKNDPMMPVAWVRDRKVDGRRQQVVVTTMGAATDFVHPGLRRFVVNAVYWTTGVEIPAKLDIDFVGDFKPSKFGFNKFVKGRKPEDYR